MFCLPSRLPRKTEDERERINREMKEAIDRYDGPIIKCPPGRAMGSGQNEEELRAADEAAIQSGRPFKSRVKKVSQSRAFCLSTKAIAGRVPSPLERPGDDREIRLEPNPELEPTGRVP
jgi:hypothetical protein